MKNTTLNWQIRGSAVMRFLGLKVYDIQLETTSAWADHEFATNPLRMKLTYAMKLEGSLIAERSLIEMRRFAKISSQQSMQWLALMQSAFPNVQKGDSLIGEADGAGVMFQANSPLKRPDVFCSPVPMSGTAPPPLGSARTLAASSLIAALA